MSKMKLTQSTALLPLLCGCLSFRLGNRILIFGNSPESSVKNVCLKYVNLDYFRVRWRGQLLPVPFLKNVQSCGPGSHLMLEASLKPPTPSRDCFISSWSGCGYSNEKKSSMRSKTITFSSLKILCEMKKNYKNVNKVWRPRIQHQPSPGSLPWKYYRNSCLYSCHNLSPH